MRRTNGAMKRVAPGRAALGALACLLAGQAPGQQDAVRSLAAAVAPAHALTFRQCVAAALRYSPALTNTVIDIRLRRLDESDARYSYFPTLHAHARYLANTPNEQDKNTSVYLTSEEWNPVETYFSVEARKVISEIAVAAHRETVRIGVHRMAEWFLGLAAVDRLTEVQNEAVELARQDMAHVKARLGRGSAVEFENREAALRAEMARLAIHELEVSRDDWREQLAFFVGLGTAEELRVDTRDAAAQVVAGFNPLESSIESACAASASLQIHDLERRLRQLDISAARARYIPKVYFGAQTVDALSGAAQESDETYVTISMSVPLWDGFERRRDIARKALILQRHDVDGSTKTQEFERTWREARAAVRKAAAELRLAHAGEELARLRKDREEIGYERGSVPFEQLLAARRAHLDARAETVRRGLAYDKTVVAFQSISGDLYAVHVRGGR